MKKGIFSLMAVSIVSMSIFSCSSSKNHTISGAEHGKNARTTYSKSISNYDYESAQNYSKLDKSYEPSVAVKTPEVLQEQLAVASTNKQFVVVAKKHESQINKIKAGEKLTTAEIKSIKAEFKNLANSPEKSEGGVNQTVAFAIAILVWLLLASIIPVHRFYLGGSKNVTAGILMIVFGVLTLGIVSWIWGLIDWIRIALGTLKPGSGDYNPKW